MLILWVRLRVEDLEEGAIPVEQEPWVPEGGQQTPTPSARGEGVKKARLYLWSGGSPGSSILHQHQDSSPTAGGGWENPVYTDLSKIQGRVWLPGRGRGSPRESPNWNPKSRTFLGWRWARRMKKPPAPICPSPTTRVANPKWQATFIFFRMRVKSIERDPLGGTDK